MNPEGLKEPVFSSLDRVVEEDENLLRYDVAERSIVHRLGMYLQEEVDDSLDVDVEYNRIGEDDDVTKWVPPEKLVRGSSGNVFPDVIVHHRGDVDGNLLVIEAKKSSNPIGGDKQKINAYVEYLGYTDGLYVEFDTGLEVEELDTVTNGTLSKSNHISPNTDRDVSIEAINTFTMDRIRVVSAEAAFPGSIGIVVVERKEKRCWFGNSNFM